MSTVAASWIFGTHGQVEVDDTGNIQVAVRAYDGSRDTPDMVSRDGFARADVSNVASLQELLGKARAFQTAVFPPAEPGRPDLEYTWQERAGAYRLLEFHHKVTPAGQNHARTVTEFLHDWGREQTQLGRAGIPEEMDAFAERWERWW
jgi:hypothetical protein